MSTPLSPAQLADLLLAMRRAQSPLAALVLLAEKLKQELDPTTTWIGRYDGLLHHHWNSVAGVLSGHSSFSLIDPNLLSPDRSAQILAQIPWLEGDAIPEWLQRPQILIVVWLRDGSAWILGVVSDQDWDVALLADLSLLAQTTAPILEHLALREEMQLLELQYRTISNRLMERYRVATEATRQVVYEWEIENGHLEWPQALQPVFGYALTPETLARNWWLERIHPIDRQRVLDQLLTCIKELQVFLCEYRWRRADGFYTWVRDYGRLFCGPQGNPVRMVGALEDIAARRSSILALQQMRHTLRASFDRIPIGLALLDSQLRVLETNLTLQTTLGYNATTLQDLSNLTMLIHPADLNSDISEFERLLTDQVKSYTTTKRLFRTDGSELACRIEVSRIPPLSIEEAPSEMQILWRVYPLAGIRPERNIL